MVTSPVSSIQSRAAFVLSRTKERLDAEDFLLLLLLPPRSRERAATFDQGVMLREHDGSSSSSSFFLDATRASERE